MRVEPGEIEATLLALPGIAAAVVTLYEDATSVPRLTAYLVPSTGAVTATETVRAALEQQLPRNMVALVLCLARRDANDAQREA